MMFVLKRADKDVWYNDDDDDGGWVEDRAAATEFNQLAATETADILNRTGYTVLILSAGPQVEQKQVVSLAADYRMASGATESLSKQFNELSRRLDDARERQRVIGEKLARLILEGLAAAEINAPYVRRVERYARVGGQLFLAAYSYDRDEKQAHWAIKAVDVAEMG